MAIITIKGGNQIQALCPIKITEDLSTELDSGTFSFIQSGKMALKKPFDGYHVEVTSSDGDVAVFPFAGIDTAALLRSKVGNNEALSKHTVELVEPSKLLEGVLIDGFGVTQPEDLSLVEKTITVSAPIDSYQAGNVYQHVAQGSITLEAFVNDCSIQGDPSYPTADLFISPSGASIFWRAQWRNSKPSYSPPDYSGIYTATIKYRIGQTLRDVVQRLLAVANVDGEVFQLTNDEIVLNALATRISPQFKWNPQTTLWECLEQVGAVIDAIPRLVASQTTDYTYLVVAFDFINESSSTADEMLDAYALPHGVSLSENQYNSSLGSVIENLLEE